MISLSKNHNPNYVCKLFQIKDINKHPNADRLQVVTVDYQTVITGLEAKEGDWYVYFPLECQIDSEFLKATNSYNDKSMNSNPEEKGFFGKSGRVKAVKLRDQPSMGYIVPWKLVADHYGVAPNVKTLTDEGIYFDTLNGKLVVQKYVPVIKEGTPRSNKVKYSKTKYKNSSKLIDNQVNLHVKTTNLLKVVNKLNPNDDVSITYKTHGTSFWVGNVLTKRKLKWYDKLLIKLGVKVQTTEYGIMYGSRRVIKSKNHDQEPKNDIWFDIQCRLKNFIPKGFTFYGEAIGYNPCKFSTYIQKDYDYGCNPGEYKLELYRVTYTDEDGKVYELNYQQIEELCSTIPEDVIKPSYLFFRGKLKQFGGSANLYYNNYLLNKSFNEYFNEKDEFDIDTWRNLLVDDLKKRFLEKDCFMCNNNVPEEGVVLRKENLLYKSVKLKID